MKVKRDLVKYLEQIVAQLKAGTELTDVTEPTWVEVRISKDNTLWVNIDGICYLRVCKPQHKIKVEDER